MHIVQIVPTIGSGSGVGGSAMRLSEEFRRLGHTVETFTADMARGHGRAAPRTLLLHRLSRVWYAVEFSIAGTRKARRFLAKRPGAVSICHNAVMAGDVYVNHGIVFSSMRARGDTFWRMVRNPLHSFTFVRDRIRYRGHTHRAIVALTGDEVAELSRAYGAVAPPVTVIPHGVDLDRFRPPDAAERSSARAALGLDAEHRVALFVGHEFERKGVGEAIAALAHAPTVLLLVVGGYASVIEKMRHHAEEVGVADRVLFAGPQTDLPWFFAAADVFLFPSHYESYGLVITEALASGVPVIATRTGCATELIEDGVNGYLVDRDPVMIGEVLERIAATEVDEWRGRCRASVANLTWRATAERYVALLREVAPERAGAA